MKVPMHHSRRHNTSILLAVAVAAASLMASAMTGEAAARSGGAGTQMSGPAPSKTQSRIRADEVRAPSPVSVQEPCKPGPHCRPPHDHTH